MGASQETVVRFLVAGGSKLEFMLYVGSGFRALLSASLMVHDLVTQSVTSACNGAFVHRHVVLVAAHGEF